MNRNELVDAFQVTALVGGFLGFVLGVASIGGAIAYTEFSGARACIAKTGLPCDVLKEQAKAQARPVEVKP